MVTIWSAISCSPLPGTVGEEVPTSVARSLVVLPKYLQVCCVFSHQLNRTVREPRSSSTLLLGHSASSHLEQTSSSLCILKDPCSRNSPSCCVGALHDHNALPEAIMLRRANDISAVFNHQCPGIGLVPTGSYLHKPSCDNFIPQERHPGITLAVSCLGLSASNSRNLHIGSLYL